MYFFFHKLLAPLVRRRWVQICTQVTTVKRVCGRVAAARLQPTMCSFSHNSNNNNELNKRDARLHPTTLVDDVSDDASGNASNASNASHSAS